MMMMMIMMTSTDIKACSMTFQNNGKDLEVKQSTAFKSPTTPQHTRQQSIQVSDHRPNYGLGVYIERYDAENSTRYSNELWYTRAYNRGKSFALRYKKIN